MTNSPQSGEGGDMTMSSTDTVFRALAHAYRRYALASLRKHGTMPLADLADEVAARAYGKSIDEIGERDAERVFISLFHTHIPMLAAADMVEYDQTEETAAIGASAEQATPFLALVNDEAAKAA